MLNASANPQASPRSKNVRGSQNLQHASDYQIAQNFVKNTLLLFLRLVSSDLQSVQVSLGSNEVDSLNFLFYSPNYPEYSISRLMPLFLNKGTNMRVPAEQIAEWITARIVPSGYESACNSSNVLYLNGIC